MNDKVGFEIEILGMEKLDNLRAAINEFKNSKKIAISLDGNFQSQIANLRSQLNLVNADLRKLKTEAKGKHDIDLDAKIKDLEIQKAAIQSAINTINAQMVLTPKFDWKHAYADGAAVFRKLGSSLEVAGNLLGNLNNNPISAAFRGVMYTIGNSFTNMMSEGLSNSISRYDTLKTYPKLMEQLGYSSESAQGSIDKLNEAVLGLPTGLDEIVDAAKRYTTTLGDIEKGTDIAIAANNAFLASASTDTQRYQGMMQLQDVLSGKRLSSREWMSLNASMAPAMREVGKELGYEVQSEFLASLYANQISNEDFMNALISVGVEGSVKDMAAISKTTMSGVISNIKVAFSRLGANLIEVLDDTLLQATGKNLVETLRGIIDQIDDVGARLKQWVKDNPQTIKRWIDNIKSIDVIGFLKSFASGMKASFTLISGITKLLPGKTFLGAIMGFSVFGSSIATMAGQLLKALQPAAGAANIIIQKLKTTGRLFPSLSNLFKSASKVDISGARKASVNASKAVSSLKSLLANIGKMLAVTTALAVVVGEIMLSAKAIEEIGKLEINFGKALKNIGEVALVFAGISTIGFAVGKLPPTLIADVEFGLLAIGAIVTTISGFAALDSWLIKKAMQNVNAIMDELATLGDKMRAFDWPDGATDKLNEALTTVYGIGAGLLLNTGFGVGGLLEWASSAELKRVMKNVVEIIDSLSDVATAMKEMDKPSASAKRNVEDIVNLMSDIFQILYDSDYIDTGFWNGDNGKIGEGEAKNVKNIVEDFKTIAENLRDIVNAMDSVHEVLDELTTGGQLYWLDTANGYQQKYLTPLAMVSRKFDDLLGQIGEIILNFQKSANELGLYETTAGGTADTIAKFQSVVANLKSVIEAYSGIYEELEDLIGPAFDSYGHEAGTKLNRITRHMGEVLSSLSRIYDTFNVYFNGAVSSGQEIIETPMGYTSVATGKTFDTEEMRANLESLRGAVDEIKHVVGAMNDMAAELESLTALSSKGATTDTSALSEVESRIKILMDSLRRIHESFMVTMEEVDFSNMGEKVETAREAFDALGEVITAVQSLQEGITAVTVGESGAYDVVEKISALMTQLSNALGSDAVDGATLLVKAQTFKLAIDSVMEAVNSLIGADSEGLQGITTALIEIGEELDNLGSKFDEFFNTQASKFRSAGVQWKNALINGLNISALVSYISVGLAGAFAPRNYYSNGFSTGESFRSGIQAALANFSVTVPTFTSTGSSIGSIATNVFSQMGLARGGLVQYRGMGGNIFKRLGTDTVPAMLTPGEYVVNRHATQTFGQAFMDRLNRLDLPGAMQAITARVGAAMNPQITNIVNNQTTNHTNNAKLTQNIYSNNPNYSYMRASRYVKAL